MADSTDDDSPACQACGNDVAQSSDYRVVTTVEDGSAVHLHFCTDECLDSWESEA